MEETYSRRNSAVNTSTIYDVEGLSTFNYAWYADGDLIDNSNNVELQVTSDLLEKLYLH